MMLAGPRWQTGGQRSAPTSKQLDSCPHLLKPCPSSHWHDSAVPDGPQTSGDGLQTRPHGRGEMGRFFTASHTITERLPHLFLLKSEFDPNNLISMNQKQPMLNVWGLFFFFANSGGKISRLMESLEVPTMNQDSSSVKRNPLIVVTPTTQRRKTVSPLLLGMCVSLAQPRFATFVLQKINPSIRTTENLTPFSVRRCKTL